MTKSNKQIAVILAMTVAIIVAIVIAYFIMRKKSNAKIVPVVDEDPSENTVSTVKTLQYGSRGDDVKRLQQFLNQQLALLIWKGLPTLNGKQITKLSMDGIFGAETQAVVKWYFGKTTVTTDQF